jgi:hypothetical protein
MRAPWLWSVVFGLCVGAGVVVVGAVRYGFSWPLLVLGLVLAAGFGGLAVIGAFVPRRTSVE